MVHGAGSLAVKQEEPDWYFLFFKLSREGSVGKDVTAKGSVTLFKCYIMQLGRLPNCNTLEQTETEYCGKGTANCRRVQHLDEKLSCTVRKPFIFQAGRLFCLSFLVSCFPFPSTFEGLVSWQSA